MSWDRLIEPPDEDDEPAEPCVICTGDESAEPCSEWCQHVYDSVRIRGEVHHLYVACRRAVELARDYRAASGKSSKRAKAALEQVRAWREDIRLVRAAQRRKAA